MPHLVTKIRSILDIYRSLIKKISANSVLIGNFIQEKFELPLLDATSTRSAKPASEELKSPPQHHSPKKPAHKTTQVTTPVKTRQEWKLLSSKKSEFFFAEITEIRKEQAA